MEPPNISELNEMNKMLFAILELTKNEESCVTKAVSNLCSSFVLGGRIVDYNRIFRLCLYTGLITYSKSKVALTELGQRFINHNKEFRYEITDPQKRFVSERLILKGPWQSNARDLFNNFDPNYKNITYELSFIEKPLLPRHNAIVNLLRVLDVLQVNNYIYSVAQEYVTLVRELRSEKIGFSENQLEHALQMNRKLGIQAEEAVLEYERKRLKAKGCNAQAALVRRISHLNVGAGYDIESFNGNKSLFDYDRFIEVKASKGANLSFFLECQ